MTIQSYITVDWDSSPRIVNVATVASVTVQDLYDSLRDIAAHNLAMDDDDIVDAGGKEGGVVGITMTLKNAQVKFENTGTPRLCKVSGGNLFAVDTNGDDMSPIAYNTNVTVGYAQSTAAAMAQDADIDTILAIIGTPTSTIASDLDYIESQVDALPQTHGTGLWEKKRGIFK